MEISLIIATAVGLWLALDTMLRSSWQRSLAVIGIGLGIACWSLGKVALPLAANVDEVIFVRRILFIGPIVLPIAWFSVGIQAVDPGLGKVARGLIGGSVAVGAFFYSCLYWDMNGDYYFSVAQFPPPGTYGPLLYVQLGFIWLMVIGGLSALVRVALKRRNSGMAKIFTLIIMSLVPLIAGTIHFKGGPLADMTPILLIPSALVMRFIVLDSGITAFVPIARRDVIEQLRLGVAVADLDGRVVDSNPAFTEMLGRDLERDDCVDELAGEIRDNPERSFEIHSFPVHGTLGELGKCLVAHDRTEARRMETQLIQAQKLESLGILSAGIAHEVNNPLAYIHANFSLLDRFAKELTSHRDILPDHLVELAADAQQILAEAKDGVDRISAMVHELKSFTGGTDRQHRPEVLQLSSLVERAATMASAGKRPDSIRIDVSPTPDVLVCPGEIVQILVNLFVNGLSACSDGSPILHTRLEASDGGCRVVVRDHGPGIEPELLAHIFDPFFTTREPGEGMGLGLSVSLDLTHKNGGTLVARNHPDGGAEFQIWFPAATDDDDSDTDEL
jgi:signal transduction histidine kinase